MYSGRRTSCTWASISSRSARLDSPPRPHFWSLRNTLGPQQISITVNGGTLFETEKNICEVNGGYDESKTSSFRRRLLLRVTGQEWLIRKLVKAMETCPTPQCYLHLMQGGRKVCHVEPKATAFGCRYWDFACVITGVWPREQDGTPLARSVVDWIYTVTEKFLAFEVYPADLVPDPRDAKLAAKAFGPNRSSITPLKRKSDPHNVLIYAFQLSRQRNLPTPIILVTGESGAEKDHCAKIWTSKLKSSTQKAADLHSQHWRCDEKGICRSTSRCRCGPSPS